MQLPADTAFSRDIRQDRSTSAVVGPSTQGELFAKDSTDRSQDAAEYVVVVVVYGSRSLDSTDGSATRGADHDANTVGTDTAFIHFGEG